MLSKHLLPLGLFREQIFKPSEMLANLGSSYTEQVSSFPVLKLLDIFGYWLLLDKWLSQDCLSAIASFTSQACVTNDSSTTTYNSQHNSPWPTRRSQLAAAYSLRPVHRGTTHHDNLLQDNSP